MEYSIYDLAGNFGVAAIIVIYLLLQLGKISSSSVYFSLFNALGAILIIISLLDHYNLSAMVVEVFWLIISLVGILRVIFSKDVKN